jgi:glutamine amidotransferase-like uncharacterized protein
MIPGLALSLAVLSACNAPSDASPLESGLDDSANSSSQLPGAPPLIVERVYQTDALLFVGNGTWASEIASLRNILSSHGATYQEVTSAQLNAMSLAEMSRFGTLIFPGGSGGTEADSLTSATHANLRAAVQQKGVGYVGFCAGAFIAQAPAPSAGGDVSYGLGIVNGPELDYYELEYQGQDIAMTLLQYADGSTQDTLYYGGPVTPEVPNGVIARYPNGDPAISQMWSGAGFVVISGPHPTATSAILSALGVSSSDGTHTETAWKMIDAAMHQRALAAF